MSNRTERANAEIQKALMDILTNDLNDPRLSDLITVTNVSVSPDFHYCKVFVSILEQDKTKRDQMFGILKGSASFIRKLLTESVRMPYSPRLTFILDEGASHSDRINEILRNLDIPQEDN